jgi:hypothetical protein
MVTLTETSFDTVSNLNVALLDCQRPSHCIPQVSLTTCINFVEVLAYQTKSATVVYFMVLLFDLVTHITYRPMHKFTPSVACYAAKTNVSSTKSIT